MQTSWIVWGILTALGAVSLTVAVRTKWLQSHTLQKCVLLSVVLHTVLAIGCIFLGGLSPASWGREESGRMTMVVVIAEEPADHFVPVESTAKTDDPAADNNVPAAVATDVPATLPPDFVPLLAAPTEEPSGESADVLVDSTAQEADASAETDSQNTASTPVSAGKTHTIPEAYADRTGQRRAAAAAARGGSQETERAVQAALAWLSAAQSEDGRWSAARYGGGVERSVQGQHRQGVGAKSDHGVSGLALLAFLGAGNTHQQGSYAENVGRGVRFLVDRQRSNGALSGEAEFFAALYCHGMATIALAECCAMTGDESLRQPLERAVRYTLSMQSPATGGWRYAAGDRGDTSQFGWQVMVLSSARNAGLKGLDQAEARARLFLQSVSSGQAGGLASYRAREQPSVAMTAEALVCRLFLGVPPEHPSVAEAVDMLANALPDSAKPNAYTWYYATLASFHAGGPQWSRWNQQLQRALLPLQRHEAGALTGSWDPDSAWGGHGGRVYATAMAAMTLEVYYRHLPMHRQVANVTSLLQ